MRYWARLKGSLTQVEVVVVREDEEALTAAGTGDWDLVVVDEALPCVTSGAFLERLHEAHPVPVIYCGRGKVSGPDLGRLVRSLGVTVLLSHPVDADELVRQASQLLQVARHNPQPGLPTQLRLLWDKFLPEQRRRLERVRKALEAAVDGALDARLREQAHMDAHRLAGSLGTFGRPRGTLLARELQGILGDSKALAPERVQRARLLWSECEKVLETPGTAPEKPSVEYSRCLLVVSQDERLVEQLAAEGVGRGVKVEGAADWMACRTALAERRPDAAVVDGDASGRMPLLREIRRQAPFLPCLTLIEPDLLHHEADTLLGQRVLPKPVSATRVLDTVERILAAEPGALTRILAIDDDPVLLESLRVLLAPARAELVTETDPLRFRDALEATHPDLLLVDVEMPYLSGIEICRSVRADARWCELPVIVVSLYNDSETIHRIFAAGADDYVSKPFTGPELVTRIANRLERSRVYRSAADRDFLGAGSRKASADGLAAMVQRARENDQELSLAVLEVRNPELRTLPTGARYRILRGVGARIRRHLREQDVVALWGPQEFAVGVFSMDRQALARRLEQIAEEVGAEAWEGHTVGVAAGVAQYPLDGTELQELYQAALAAAARSRAGGRRVEACTAEDGQSRQSLQRVDVAVALVDPGVADPLVRRLEQEEWRVLRLDNREAALEHLAGATPKAIASLVILDHDLGVLEELAPDLARRSRVLLVGQASEAEILAAYDLGVHEFVPAPFNLSVLMRRVEKALER